MKGGERSTLVFVPEISRPKPSPSKRVGDGRAETLCDARERASGKEVLIALIEHLMGLARRREVAQPVG